MNTNYQYGGPRPWQPSRDASHCGTTQLAQIIPKDSDVEWERVPMAPSTVKHLYSEIPNHYEQRFQYRPTETLYGHQFKQTYLTGMGRKKVIGGGHYKVYPLTNRHVTEDREYTSYNFPRPSWQTQRQRGVITSDTHVRTEGWT